MANNAHFISDRSAAPTVIVRDDRGVPVTQLDLPDSTTSPGQAEAAMLGAGWIRSADWTQSDDGWLAPVVPA